MVLEGGGTDSVLFGEGLIEEPDHDGEVAPFIVAATSLERRGAGVA